jgi:hypothetical protein
MYKVWRKILYEAQPFEDCYVDSSFLEQLRMNGRIDADIAPSAARSIGVTENANVFIHVENVREYDYWGMTKSSAAITQQISLVSIFFVRAPSTTSHVPHVYGSIEFHPRVRCNS